MDDAEVNTTHRYNNYCTGVSEDGRRCSLYSPHKGDCQPKHGLEKDRFVPVNL